MMHNGYIDILYYINDSYSAPVCTWKISEELWFGHLNQIWKEKENTPKTGYQEYHIQKPVATFEIRIKL